MAFIPGKSKTKVEPEGRRFQCRYFDAEMRLWFDLGDPRDTEAEARALIAEFNKEEKMSDRETFTTPEGFELHKRLMMPDARDFAEVLTYVREWDHSTMTHTSGNVPEPGLVPDPVIIDGNEVGPFCSVKMRDGEHRSIAVIPTEATIEALTGQFVTDDDRLSFELILHPERDRVLVVCQHNKIVGSRYVAYIDPTTIPTKEA